MRRIVLLVALLGLWCAQPAEAKCSGSGLALRCTAGTNPGQVNGAIGRAKDGATVTFEPGRYTWGDGDPIAPSISKGVTLICAPQGACEVEWTGIAFELPIGTSNKLYRWSGFRFIHPSGRGQLFYHCPGGNCGATTLSNVRIDHNTFDHGGSEQIIQTDTATVLNFYGV